MFLKTITPTRGLDIFFVKVLDNPDQLSIKESQQPIPHHARPVRIVVVRTVIAAGLCKRNTSASREKIQRIMWV